MVEVVLTQDRSCHHLVNPLAVQVYNFKPHKSSEIGCESSSQTLVTCQQPEIGLLTFTKAERVATVQMQGTNFGGNDVLITVAPAVRAGSARP